MVSTYNGLNYSIVKRNEGLTHSTMWMDLGNIPLCETRQTLVNRYYVILRTRRHLEKSTLQRQKVEKGLPGAREREERGVPAQWDQVSV